MLQFVKSDTETHKILVQVYRTDVVRKKYIYNWFKRFHLANKTVYDEPCSGRSSKSVTTDNIERVREMLLNNRQLSVRWISEEIEIGKDNVRTIIDHELDNIRSITVCTAYIDFPSKGNTNTRYMWQRCNFSANHLYRRWEFVLPVQFGV